MPTLHIQLSGPTFDAIAGMAQAQGQSIEAFVLEAARRRVEDEAPIRLTPEQIAICDLAEADIDAGRFFTLDEVRAQLAARRAARSEEHQP